MVRKRGGGKSRRFTKMIVCVMASAFLLSACGMSKNASSQKEAVSAYTESAAEVTDNAAYDNGSYDRDSASEESEDVIYASETGAGQEAGTEGQEDEPSSNRKIVYTGSVSLQTLEYDKSAKSIHDKIAKYGGFIESENTSNDDPYWYYRDRSGLTANRTRRNLTITARIPAEQFDAFMDDLKNDGQVINTFVNARNISVSYATHDASRKALEIEQGRLLDMMEKAETIEEMIAVEERLTQVERELGDEKTTLSAMDRDVNFSTVDIQLEEVFEYSERVVQISYGERLKRAFDSAIEGFVEFWQTVLLFIVGSFPFLIMLGIVIFVIVKLARRSHRRQMERYAALEAARRNAAAAGMPGAPNVPGAGYAAYCGGTPEDNKPGQKASAKGLFSRRKHAEKMQSPEPGQPTEPDQSAQTVSSETSVNDDGKPKAADET